MGEREAIGTKELICAGLFCEAAGLSRVTAQPGLTAGQWVRHRPTAGEGNCSFSDRRLALACLSFARISQLILYRSHSGAPGWVETRTELSGFQRAAVCGWPPNKNKRSTKKQRARGWTRPMIWHHVLFAPQGDAELLSCKETCVQWPRSGGPPNSSAVSALSALRRY
jgi:hypothetical protein